MHGIVHVAQDAVGGSGVRIEGSDRSIEFDQLYFCCQISLLKLLEEKGVDVQSIVDGGFHLLVCEGRGGGR